MTNTSQTKTNRLKICYVLAYKSPNYIRTTVLLELLQRTNNAELFKAINTRTGISRYLQTIWKLFVIRVKHNPDIYVLGFRGFEIFFMVRILTSGKKLIYDEFINPYMWFVEEHKIINRNSLRSKVLRAYTHRVLLSADKVLTDTQLQADYSSKEFRIPISKFLPIYVGTDESAFSLTAKSPKHGVGLNVLFYGTFLPLHGVDVILGAAELLKGESIKFKIVGGAGRKSDMKRFLDRIQKLRLNNIEHLEWVPYEDLPSLIESADVCLGGPFGNTFQARRVITGKTYQFLAMGKPTVIGKIDEEVGFVDKLNCIIVDQGSIKDLVSALRWCLDNEQKLLGIGRMGSELYHHKFSLSSQESTLDNILK